MNPAEILNEPGDYRPFKATFKSSALRVCACGGLADVQDEKSHRLTIPHHVWFRVACTKCIQQTDWYSKHLDATDVWNSEEYDAPEVICTGCGVYMERAETYYFCQPCQREVRP